MDKLTQGLYAKAKTARAMLQDGSITYERAVEMVKTYTDHANTKGKVIAKKFGMKHKDIDPIGFLR